MVCFASNNLNLQKLRMEQTNFKDTQYLRI